MQKINCSDVAIFPNSITGMEVLQSYYLNNLANFLIARRAVLALGSSFSLFGSSPLYIFSASFSFPCAL